MAFDSNVKPWSGFQASSKFCTSHAPSDVLCDEKKKIQFSHNQFDPVKRNYKSIKNKRALILVKRHREEDPFLQGRTGLSGGAGKLIRTLLSMNPSVEKHLPPKSNETTAKD